MFIAQRHVELLLLGHLRSEDGVQPIEDAPQIVEILGRRPFVGELAHHPVGEADEVEDLRVRAGSDEDLAILGPVTLIIAGAIVRAGVFAPATVQRLLGEEEDGGS